MKGYKKVLKLSLTILACVVLVLIASVYGISEYKLRKEHEVNDYSSPGFVSDSVAVLRGEYLSSVTNCTLCHGNDLGGAIYYEGFLGRIIGPNLTQGKGSAVKGYTDEDWIRSIKRGVDRNKRSLLVMPSEVYVKLSTEDANALIAYLKQVSPVNRNLGKSELGFAARALVTIGKLPLLAAEKVKITDAENPSIADSTVTGSYLMEIYSCKSCHKKDLSGGKQMGIPGAPQSTNLTPAEIGHWTKEDFATAVRTGIRPDGKKLNDIMPWRNYSQLTNEEIDAMWIYLRGLPPTPSKKNN